MRGGAGADPNVIGDPRTRDFQDGSILFCSVDFGSVVLCPQVLKCRYEVSFCGIQVVVLKCPSVVFKF